MDGAADLLPPALWPLCGLDAHQMQALLDEIEPPARQPHLQWAWCPLEGPAVVVGVRWQTDEAPRADESVRVVVCDRYVLAEARTAEATLKDGVYELVQLLERPLLILPSTQLGPGTPVRATILGPDGHRPTRIDGFQRLVSPRFCIEFYACYMGGLERRKSA